MGSFGGGWSNFISKVLTSGYYLPNILLVPLVFFHSVIHASSPLLLQMSYGISVTTPFEEAWRGLLSWSVFL